MTLDDLTLGQLRELAALLPGILPAAPAPPLYTAGTPVMIRDHMAGLFVGVLHAGYRTGESGWALRAGARKIHYWSKAPGPEGAVLCGPGPGSRVCPPTSRPRAGAQLVEIVGLTESELAGILACPVWTP